MRPYSAYTPPSDYPSNLVADIQVAPVGTRGVYDAANSPPKIAGKVVSRAFAIMPDRTLVSTGLSPDQ